jgi:hypothetical protein
VTASPKFLIAVGLFVVGAFVGSLAPVFSLVGSNQYLLKLLLQTWQIDHSPTAGGPGRWPAASLEALLAI